MPSFVAHGQNWEDVRLRRLFGESTSGFYIDVGAGHPVFHSFSYTLYQQGWRGVNVEPLPSFFALLECERPEDTNLQAVVGMNTSSTANFYEAPEMRGSSTLRDDIAQQLRSNGITINEFEVSVLSLAEICRTYAPAKIDILKVDVEGSEAEVLSSGAWERYRPRLVVVEANQPSEWEPMLLDRGYLHAAFDGVNHWYVEKADRAWVEILTPPVSVLDDFVPFELVQRTSGGALPQREGLRPSASVIRLTRQRRARMLLALSSANQLYSGTGRVLFETVKLLDDRFELEISIDDTDTRNVTIAQKFCSEHRLRLHIASGKRSPGAPDTVSDGLAGVMRAEPWDLVLAISWANAATNQVVLEHVGDSALAYLPLFQPSWTIPLDDGGAATVEGVNHAMLVRSDVVFCLSPWERQALVRLVAPHTARCAVVPPGCDFATFQPGAPERGRDLLFVGDHREPRKRFDRVVALMERLRELGVEARVRVVGNDSNRAIEKVPSALVGSFEALGYVTEARLLDLYKEAAALLLLSDYEAFGLPVMEALASATPVIMTRQPAPESLFDGLTGMHFVDANELNEVARIAGMLLDNGARLREDMRVEHEKLARRFDWNVAAHASAGHLMAAWARRSRATAGFLAM